MSKVNIQIEDKVYKVDEPVFKEIEKAFKEIERLNNIINNAIEYIRSQYTITDDDLYLALYSSDGTLDKLENILEGEDKE